MYNLAEARNADIVCASRYMKGGKQTGGPVIKGLMSRVAGLTLYYFAKVPTHDSTNSFKLYRTSFLKNQRIESTGGFELGLELVAKAHVRGYTICETPTAWTDRVAGKSNFKLLAWLGNYLKWYFYAFKGSMMERMAKYVLAGSLCALINWVSFYALNYVVHIQYLIAATIAFVVSTSASYLFSSKWIFASRGRKKYSEYLLVIITSGIALAIDLGVMYALVEWLKMPPLLAKIIGSATEFLVNFTSRQFFIFSPKKD
jgi:putative flippase GtrA